MNDKETPTNDGINIWRNSRIMMLINIFKGKENLGPKLIDVNGWKICCKNLAFSWQAIRSNTY